MFDFQRVLTGTILIIVLAFCYYFNLDFFIVFLLFILILYDLIYSKILNNKFIYLISIPLILLGFFLDKILLFLIFFFLFFIISIYFYKLSNIFFSLSLFIFIIICIELIQINRNYFYLLISVSFFNDTSAYIVGKTIKGPLIIPSISPKKTYSGTLVSMVISFLFLFFIFNNTPLLLILLISLSFFLGDIYFSSIKRRNKIKDFSNILNGHGGILDRLDSNYLSIPILLISLII